MSAGKAKPRVVYIGRYNFSEQLSGPEKTAKRLFEEHSKNNETYFIQYFFDGTKYTLKQKLSGLETERINGNAVVYTAGILETYKLLKKLKPDIIHIITFERFAAAAIPYKWLNTVKIIYNSHGVIAYENSELKQTGFFYRLKDKLCEKRFLKNSDKVVFVSPAAIDTAERYYSIDESKAVILSNGIDKVFSRAAQKNFTAGLKAVFIYPNDMYESGIRFLCELFARFNPQIELFVITGLSIPAEINARIFKPMPAEELAEFYRDKHIFFALNSYDTFSISTAEAMAAGLVPIITGETGISRFIEKGVNGYTVPYGDINALNNAVTSFTGSSPDKKREISTRASEIYNELNWKNVYGAYENIYNEMKR